jgi:acyl-CoA thioesterase
MLHEVNRLWEGIAFFNKQVAAWQHLNVLFQLITAIAK